VTEDTGVGRQDSPLGNPRQATGSPPPLEGGQRGGGRDTAPSDTPLAVDLIGPPLLFQGLAGLLFQFPDVASVRLLAVRVANAAQGYETQGRIADAPLTEPPCQTVGLYWHESFPPRSTPLFRTQNAILFGQTFPENAPNLTEETRSSVWLSVCDTPETLHTGLLCAASGQAFRSSLFLQAPPTCHAEVARLSPREREITDLAAIGLSNAEIAACLFLGTATVKAHLARAFAKLRVNRRSQLRDALLRSGYPPPAPSSVSGARVAYEYVEIICHTKDGFFVSALS
jgi:DNA-binding CsgD family transcriptional regulator